MTIRYVGPGGDNGNSGLTWALRKLTLNGVEDTPIVAGDVVYIGPGVYRETLSCDVDGSSGNEIDYIGDITGENTDGVGGLVRITGLATEDSYPAARSVCASANSKDYRRFYNIYFGENTGAAFDGELVTVGGIDMLAVEFHNCVFGSSATSDTDGACGISFVPTYSAGPFGQYVIKNCWFSSNERGATKVRGSTQAVNALIENCFSWGAATENSYSAYGFVEGGLSEVRHCTAYYHRYLSAHTAAAGDDLIYDCLLLSHHEGIQDTSCDDSVEDYNAWSNCGQTCKTGGNSITANMSLQTPLLYAGFKLPWDRFEPVGYSANIYHTPETVIDTDIYGLSRPGGAKQTYGAIQYKGVIRDSSEYRTGPSSLRLDDASKHIVSIPVSGTKGIKVDVFVKREADYSGTNPQLVLSFPTQTPITVTDVGSTGAYNRLKATVTPGANDRWLQIQLISNNTATSGDYQVWFDDLKIVTSKASIPTMKWATAEIPLFCFSLDNVADPWITPTIPVPVFQGDFRTYYPMPSNPT